MTQDLEQPHDGEVADVGEEAGAPGLEAVSAQSKDLEIPEAFPEVSRQLRGVEVTGRLAAGDEQTRSGPGGHAGAV